LPDAAAARAVAGRRIGAGVLWAAVTLGTVATAATLQPWVHRGVPTEASPPHASGAEVPPQAVTTSVAQPARGSSPLPSPVSPQVSPPVSSPDPVEAPEPAAPSTRTPVKPAAAPPATQAATTEPRYSASDESKLIVRAVRALRREGDPARAEALAEQALSRFPRGAQVEEAMDLVMESTAAKGDAAGAQRAASAYLERFPSGRFVDRAAQILASSPK